MKTFSFFEVRKQWVEAVEYCTSKGLRLATISSLSELKRAQSKVEGVNEDVWLAGNDISKEGRWRWAKGSVDEWNTFINAGGSLGLEFNWKFGYPHQTRDEDCLYMHYDGKFGDYGCNRDMYVLCDDGTD